MIEYNFWFLKERHCSVCRPLSVLWSAPVTNGDHLSPALAWSLILVKMSRCLSRSSPDCNQDHQHYPHTRDTGSIIISSNEWGEIHSFLRCQFMAWVPDMIILLFDHLMTQKGRARGVCFKDKFGAFYESNHALEVYDNPPHIPHITSSRLH